MVEERHARRLVKALDTNILIRLAVADDESQRALAEAQLTNPVLLPLTVLLETAWVLRSRYGFDRRQVSQILRGLIDYPTVTVEARPSCEWAIDRYATHGDFADLIHIVASRGASAFVTFDRAVARAAGDDAPVSVELLV